MARRRNNKKNGNKKTFGARDDSKAQNKWNDLVRENAKWELYYREKLNLFTDEEWESFKKTCQAPLPLTFRVTGSRNHAHEVLNLFKERHLPNLTNVVFEGETLKAPLELPWYPGKLAWQLDVPKTVIRKNEQFAKTQRYLVIENAVGNISRQEAVSMIPPIVLEVEPHHTVLDMCAAPGSKTAQLIEALHRDNEEPTGFVVANDADARRSHMLVHQLKRLNSANLMVVNHDAQFFPRMRTIVGSDKKSDLLKFDRILCDVPCSGDGTMRKNVNVWKDWNTQGGLGLHQVQFNILNRGLNLLQNGGRLVYSTCSMNPIENEAVVAAALRKWGDKVRLMNCDEKLPGLIRNKGITSWPVIDRNMETKNKGDENTLESWFPPSEEEIAKFNLQNCIRVYPHQQNTGGFFITVFEKVEDLDNIAASKKRLPTPDEGTVTTEKKVKTNDESAVPQKKERLPRDANEEPFVFVDPKHKAIESCWSFYGIDDKFDRNTCLVRNATGEPTRVIYTVSPSLRDVIQANEDRLKFIYAGVKLFVSQRSDIECSWRIQGESLQVMKNHMSSKRIVKANLDMLKILLTDSFPKFEDLEATNADNQFLEDIKNMSSGCAFIDIDRHDGEKENLFLPVWKGTKCINLMVSKEDTHELLYRIFNIETSAKDNSKAQKPKKEEATEEQETKTTEEEAAK